MRISDWSSDVCSSDLAIEAAEHHEIARQRHDMPGRAARIRLAVVGPHRQHIVAAGPHRRGRIEAEAREGAFVAAELDPAQPDVGDDARRIEFEEAALARRRRAEGAARSEEHTSELQSLMRISNAVFCLTKKT